MRYFLIYTLLLGWACSIWAQQRPDFRNEYYLRKRAMHESMTPLVDGIVMLGNSITEQGTWNELFPKTQIVNRGIGGDRLLGMIDRLPAIVKMKPSKIFIMAGINDLLFTDVSTGEFEKEYCQLIDFLIQNSPQTKIYLQSILPVNDVVGGEKRLFLKNQNQKIKTYNQVIEKLANKKALTYLDLYPHMLTKGLLNVDYTFDGIHLNEKGYAKWKELLSEYIIPKAEEAKINQDFRNYFYDQRCSFFEAMPDTSDEVIMLGNSITNGASWDEIFPDVNIKNRGVSGDITLGVLDRIGEVTSSQPLKIFILIGINDIARNIPTYTISANYKAIVERIKADSPKTKIYIQSVMPTNDEYSDFKNHQGKTDKILELNNRLKQLAKTTGAEYIDLYTPFVDEDGKLSRAYTNDGLHLLGTGYQIWASTIRKYIY